MGKYHPDYIDNLLPVGTFRKIFNLMEAKERRRGGWLFVLFSVVAIMDAAGVASIMPFMAILTNPNIVENNNLLLWIYKKGDFQSIRNFQFALGAFCFAVVILSGTLKTIVIYAQHRFAAHCEYAISGRLIEGYLRQPYAWFLERNSANLGKNILNEVHSMVVEALIPMLTLFAQIGAAVAIVSVLLILDWEVAVITLSITGLVYGLILYFMQGRLLRIGEERVEANAQRFVAASECFSAIKEIKAANAEGLFAQRFFYPARKYVNKIAEARVCGQLPVSIMESLAFGGILAFTLWMMARKNDFAAVIPVIALYSYAGYRLMPALQKVYSSLATLKYADKVLDLVHEEYKNLPSTKPMTDEEGKINVQKVISLSGVYFRYPNAKQRTLRNINLSVKKGSTVGLVGPTGGGKSTIVDIILGLLEPQKGHLKIDGITIDKLNVRSWRSQVGYVPQQVYLCDDTIASNIAFGVRKDLIDGAELNRVSKISKIHNYVINELEEGFQAEVGERGVRLSGGQLQRVGIARALYGGRRVLVLDEATSALDNETERLVIDSIKNLGQEVTTIMIAHRLSTIRNCDKIFLIDSGEIKAQGSYEELLESSSSFRKLAQTMHGGSTIEKEAEHD